MSDTLSVAQYANLMGVSTRTVQRWVKAHKVFGVKIGRGLRIPKDELPPSVYLENLAPIEIKKRFDPEAIIADPKFKFDTERIRVLPGIHRPSEFERIDLRQMKPFLSDAYNWAKEIPLPTIIYQRPDGYWQVVLDYDGDDPASAEPDEIDFSDDEDDESGQGFYDENEE